MGNKQPKERHGESCCRCSRHLSPTTSFDRLKHVDNWYWGPSYEFNSGEYFRQKSNSSLYYCSSCWWGAVSSEQQRRNEQQRQAEEARQRHRAEQRRQEELRREQAAQRAQKREEYNEQYTENMENEQSLSGKGYNWMKEQMHEQAQHRQVQKAQYKYDTDQTMIAEWMESKQDGGVDITRSYSFTEEDLLDPHFKEKVFVKSLEKLFLVHPFSGQGFSLNRQKAIQTWLLQMFLEKECVTEMLHKNMIEYLLVELQDVIPPEEIFTFTKAMVEVAIYYKPKLFDKFLNLKSSACEEKSESITPMDENHHSEDKRKRSKKEIFFNILSQFLVSDSSGTVPRHAGIIYLACLINSNASREDGYDRVWIRKSYQLLLQHAYNIKGEDWKHFIAMCLSLVTNCHWKPIDILGFAMHLGSESTSTESANKRMTVLNMILAYRIPVSYFDTQNETIETAMEKAIDFIETEEDIPLEGILKMLKHDYKLDNTMLEYLTPLLKDVHMKINTGSIPCDSGSLRNLIRACFVDGKQNTHNDMVQILFTLCSAVKSMMKWWPRVTQICSTAILLLADRDQQSHLLEIATGEGKSCVVAMFTTVLALQGEYVDIVTSSPVLAGRDAEEWKPYYNFFGLDVGCNGALTNNDERMECYRKHVVYGTVSDFAADILRQEFEMDDVRGEYPNVRRFDNIMVDEVDQMTLDQGVQFTYLSHRMVGIRQLEPLLAIIWAVIQQNIPLKTEEDELLFAGPTNFLFDAIIQGVDPESCGISNYAQMVALAEKEGLASSSFSLIVQGVDIESKKEAWKEFSIPKMLDYIKALDSILPVSIVPFLLTEDSKLRPAIAEQTVGENEEIVFILLLDNGMACPLFEMEEVALGAVAKVKEAIKFTKPSLFVSDNSEQKIKVPGFLEKYVENRLPVFIKSAFTAMTLTENREYVVKDGQIFPVDFGSTGVIEKSKKWGEGLQQFIEMKHFCAISSLSLVTNFMSNLAFFKRYNNIFGVSGTLGTSAELGFLQEHYNLKITKIPTHKEKKLYNTEIQIVESTKESWLSVVCNELQHVVLDKPWGETGRAALVICEDIKTAKEFHSKIKQNVSSSTHIYIQNDNAGREVLSQELGPGSILVATNLAGRGTNVKVTKEVNRNGGLFVLLSFIPTNKRVELQAFGRTARKGAPGSATIIAHKSSLAPYFLNESQGKIMTIRDDFEARRIEHMTGSDIKEVALREKLFSQYCVFLEDVYEKVKGDRKEDITLSSLHETWGIWLQMQSERISNLEEQSLRRDLDLLVSDAKLHIFNNESPSENVYHTIRFANELIKHGGDQQPAIDHFTRAISMDNEWASIAYYNRARCIIQQSGDDYMSKAHDDLIMAGKHLKSDIESAMAVYQIVVKTKTSEDTKYFAEQCMRRQEIINAFRENIEAAHVKLQELMDNGDDALVDRTAVFHILPNAGKEEVLLLLELEEMGLEEVYQIKKKPVFSISALIVTLLGALQVVVGALLVATGIGATFGMSLITEGVSDVVAGIEGMVTGDFSLKDWAIEKAASIAISIVTSGLGKAIVAAKKLGVSGIKAALKQGVKGGVQGMKCAIKNGVKQGIKSVTTVATGTFKETFKNVSKAGWKATVKANLKTTATLVAKEVTVECSTHLISYGIDQAFEEIMTLVEERIKRDIEHKFHNSLLNGKLRTNCDIILLDVIPDFFLKDNQMSAIQKTDVLDLTVMHCQSSVEILVSKSEVADILGKHSKEFMSKLNKEVNGPKGPKRITYAIEAGYDMILITKMVATSVNLSNKFEDVFNQLINDYIRDMKIKTSSNSLPPIAIEFKRDISKKIADTYSSTMATVLKGGLSATVMARCIQGVSMVVGNILGNKILEIEKTKDQLEAASFATNLMYCNQNNTERAGDITTPRRFSSNTDRAGDITTPRRVSSNTDRAGDITTPRRFSSNTDRADDITTPRRFSSNTDRAGDITTPRRFSRRANDVEEEQTKFSRIVRDPNYSGSLLEMRIACEKLNLDITIVNVDKSGKRSVTGSVSNSDGGDGDDKTKITLVYKSDGQHTKSLYVEDSSGNLHSVKRNDVFHAIAKGRDPSGDEDDIVTKSRNLRQDIVQEVNNNSERWSRSVSKKLKLDASTHQRQILLDGGTNLSSEDPFVCKVRLSMQSAHDYVKTHVINVVSDTLITEFQLGLVKLTQRYARNVVNPHARPARDDTDIPSEPSADAVRLRDTIITPRPFTEQAGYDMTSRTYPSESTVELIKSRDNILTPQRFLTIVNVEESDESGSVPELTSLKAHSSSSIYSRSESNASVVDNLIADRITDDDMCGFLKLSFTGDFPDNIRTRYSHVYQEKESEYLDLHDEPMVLDIDTINYYRHGFLGVADYYYEEKLMTKEENDKMRKWIMNKSFADTSSKEYKFLVKQLKEEANEEARVVHNMH